MMNHIVYLLWWKYISGVINTNILYLDNYIKPIEKIPECMTTAILTSFGTFHNNLQQEKNDLKKIDRYNKINKLKNEIKI